MNGPAPDCDPSSVPPALQRTARTLHTLLHADRAARTVAEGAPARIGPNAITRMAEAVRAALGDAATAELFDRAGLGVYLRTPPQHMVDEAEVTRLHRALRAWLPAPLAGCMSRDAGERTADYLLAHRIPPAVQWMLRHLPARVAARVLVAAIRRHSWTFAGSADFHAAGSGPVRLRLTGCPLCRGSQAAANGCAEPCCDFYAACFERLFRVLVHPAAKVRETACSATGASACCFDVDWQPGVLRTS